MELRRAWQPRHHREDLHARVRHATLRQNRMSTKAADKLTPRQGAFVREYLVDLNGTQAALRAGYAAASAASQASELLRVPKIAKAIADAQAERARRTDVTADRVVKELARVAFADPAHAYGTDGRILAVHEMPVEARAALAGMDVEEGEAGGVTRKLKTWNKVQALELLGKHLGMWTEKVQVGGPDGEPVQVVVNVLKAGGET